jgi:hypothetical protein
MGYTGHGASSGNIGINASAGQISRHSPQPVHRSINVNNGGPSNDGGAGRKARSGQVFRHAPQPLQPVVAA